MTTWQLWFFVMAVFYTAVMVTDLNKKIDKLQAQIEHLHRQLVK